MSWRLGGHPVNRKRVQRLMRHMGVAALYPKRRTSAPGRDHKVYPYLLTGVSVERANQVWATDICYLPMAKGFMYLVAVMDWLSRRVLSWRVSNTLDREFCVEALEEALARYGAPEIFNTDQGAQGRFKRSSQHLNGEELRWEHRNVVGHPVRDVFRCGRRVVPRRDAVSIGVGSGRRSPAGCPATRRRWGPACPSRSERDGSAKVEACRRSAWPLCRGATCRLPSEKRSPSCTPSTAGFVISLGESTGPRRPSLGSSVAMRQPAVADSSIARRPRSGTPT